MQIPGWAKPIIAGLFVIVGATILLWQMRIDDSKLLLGGTQFHTTVMKSGVELQQGLSGTSSLPADHAMVFVFPTNGKWSMWMKDMKYSIDIMWLNSDKQVVHIVKNASPASYPGTEYEPDVPSRYVIELPSGTVDKLGIKKGDFARLPIGI